MDCALFVTPLQRQIEVVLIRLLGHCFVNTTAMFPKSATMLPRSLEVHHLATPKFKIKIIHRVLQLLRICSNIARLIKTKNNEKNNFNVGCLCFNGRDDNIMWRKR